MTSQFSLSVRLQPGIGHWYFFSTGSLVIGWVHLLARRGRVAVDLDMNSEDERASEINGRPVKYPGPMLILLSGNGS